MLDFYHTLLAMFEQTKKDLQGWGMVFAVQQDVLNGGLKKLQDLIPEKYQEINYEHTISAPIFGNVDATVSNAALGVIQVSAKADGLKLTDVLIPFDSGSVSVE